MPATLLWGASFPLALAAASSESEEGTQDPGRLVGGVYAANTLGAILGALMFSMLFMPMMGSQGAQRVLISVAAFSGVLALAPMIVAGLGRGSLEMGVVLSRAACTVVLAIAIATVPFLTYRVPSVSKGLVAWGRNLMINSENNIIYVGEGMNSSVAVSGQVEGTRYFHVAGKVEASSEPQDMRLQRMLGHIPALLPSQSTARAGRGLRRGGDGRLVPASSGAQE